MRKIIAAIQTFQNSNNNVGNFVQEEHGKYDDDNDNDGATLLSSRIRSKLSQILTSQARDDLLRWGD